ncbi:MAG: hypothetical protein U1E12_15500 [Hydrogenophaga sp.]|uniref:hypothetical protein n=1 Tax=Hydrogenophaga sp. TaxID=1904254 RepID=UPI002ABCEF42|nr:hypothetical protein [Hydrogenophaga sp.]MDZ4103072.1 hypothetical protein [Hydrogenophaga sp.]
MSEGPLISDNERHPKEYGKLTAAQFAELIQYVPVLLKLIRELSGHMSKIPQARFDEVMEGPYWNYSQIYEFSFARHLATLLVVMNRHKDFGSLADAADPQEAVLEVLRSMDKVEDDRPLYDGATQTEAIALIYSFGQTVTSMATYGRSISALVKAAREQRDHDALFKAIRMDRAVIGCPTSMHLIARAQLRDNKTFFRHLRSALAGPSKKQWEGLHPMRYAFILLNEMGLHSLSEAELESLMVDTLKVYPKSPSARKNLRAQYLQYRKYTTI